MATDFELEREIRAAFAEVVPRGADPALATSIRARLAETTVVRRRSGPLLGRPALAAGLLAAAVIVLIAVPLIGRVGQPTPPSIPGVGASPSASPSPSATASTQPSTAGAIAVHKDMFGDQNVQAARLVTDSVGWVRTDSALYRTADGGRSWTDVPLPTGGVFGATSIVDADTVYIAFAGNPVTIASTHDGGASWTMATIRDDFVDSGLALTFETPQLGFATFLDSGATPGRMHVYQTDDGGRSWTGPVAVTLPDGQVKTNPIEGSVLSLNVGKADNKPFNDHLWLSMDGGQTWKRRTFPIDKVAPAGHLKWLIGVPWVEDGGRIVLPIAVDGGRNAIYESNDDGASWRVVKAWPSPNIADFSVQFLSGTEWILAALDGSDVWSTADGGGTWRQVSGAAPILELSTSWASRDHGWALHVCAARRGFPGGPDKYCDGTGLKSVLFETTDGGATWAPIGG